MTFTSLPKPREFVILQKLITSVEKVESGNCHNRQWEIERDRGHGNSIHFLYYTCNII